MAEKEPIRSLPHNIDAERSVLAAMLHDSEAMLSGFEVLRELDEMAKRESVVENAKGPGKVRAALVALTLFYHTPYQSIFDLVSELESHGRVPDLTTLIEEARRNNLLDKIGGTSGLLEVLGSTATGVHVREYAEIVKEKYLKRRLILTSNEILERAYEDSSDAGDLLSEAEQSLHRISDSRHTGSFVKIGDLLGAVQEAIYEAHERKGMVTGVQTHFHTLDEMTSGLQKSDLIILAARPSMGKTALALNILENVAKDHHTVGLFSLEMSALQIVQRILCSMSRVDLARLRGGKMSNREISQVFNILGSMATLPFYIDDTPGLSIASLRARSIRLKHKEPNLALLVIDYLQLMEGSSSKGGNRNRQEEVSTISRGLKGLARELEVPVLALSQLSRGVESRESGIPKLSDLRESGAIEQDADLVMFIHRKRNIGGEEEEEGEDVKAEIIIGKQRNGPVGSVPVAFISRYASFANLRSFDDLEVPPDTGSGDYDTIDEMTPDEGVPF